ncbi:MAG: hypothetical protein GEV10_15055 [Streptosporangiales bacterium]|nr:hypothetical protein [Streptosporangiales bacterium]
MLRRFLGVVLGTVCLLVSGCSGETVARSTSTPEPVGSPPSALPTPAKADPDATKNVAWDEQRGRWSVFELYRHGRYVTLEFGVTNLGDDEFGIGSTLSRREAAEDVSGVTVRDPVGKKRYLPATFAGGCYCTSRPYTVGSGQTMYLTATYAAPPKGVEAVDVSVPQVGTFADVPVTAEASPRATLESPPGLPEPVASKVIQAKGGEYSGTEVYVVASVYGIYRRGSHVYVYLGVGLDGTLPYEEAAGSAGLFAASNEAADDPSEGESTGITLVDATRGTAHQVARVAGGKCLCSVDPTLYAYGTTIVAATFAAPATEVEAMDVVLPHIGVFPGVPIRKGALPEPDAPSPLPGSSYDSVSVAEPDGKGAPVKAPVVRVQAKVQPAS